MTWKYFDYCSLIATDSEPFIKLVKASKTTSCADYQSAAHPRFSTVREAIDASILATVPPSSFQIWNTGQSYFFGRFWNWTSVK